MHRDPDSFKIFLVILGIFVLCFFIFPRNNYEKKYEELYDQYLELENKLEQAESKYDNTLDSVYKELSDTFDSVHTVFNYFEYQEVSFDEAHHAFDEVFNVLIKYY